MWGFGLRVENLFSNLSSTDLGRAGLRDLVRPVGVELEDGGDSGANVLKLGRVLEEGKKRIC